MLGYFEVIVAACLWGTWSLFLRPSGLPSSATAPIVFFTMAVVLIPLYGRESSVKWSKRTWILFAMVSLFDATNLGTFFGAMERTTVAVAVLTHYLAPVLVALFAPIIDKERVPGAVFSALLATGGLVLILEPWRPENLTGDVGLGALLGTISAFAYAGNVFTIKRLAGDMGPARAMGYHSIVSGMLLLPFAPIETIAHARPSALALLLVAATFVGAMTGWLFVRGLRRIGAARASVLTFLEPLVAVLVGYFVWHEPLGPLAIVGAAMILGAGLMTTRTRNN